MLDPIRRAVLWLRLLLVPGTGKRRRTRDRPGATVVPAMTTTARPVARLPGQGSGHRVPDPVDHGDVRLVRPYVLAHAESVALGRRRCLPPVPPGTFGTEPCRGVDRPRVAGPGVAA
ncbi:hypothetical protein [Streptomyces sp. WMMC905]|uniref:hypothetical protein n=1 Tax=Streptomyces sp. WMMC905 TaxID=3404123 RepID=UPI003B94F252